jgi:hypothetical protein
MKKIFLMFLATFALLFYTQAQAGEINDVHNGNGIRVVATADTITVELAFSPADKSTMGGRVKYAIPYNGSSADDGVLLAVSGDEFVGRLGYPDLPSQEVVAKVGPGGIGPLVFTFKNPTKAGEMPTQMVFRSYKKGSSNQTVAIPWEPKLLYFARANAKHPQGAQHTTAFAVAGDKVSDVVAQAAADGWKPTRVYWASKMGSGAPWGLSNLMSGQTPKEK